MRKYHTRVTKEISQRIEAEGEDATEQAFIWCLATLTRGGFTEAASYLQQQIINPSDPTPTEETS